MADEYDTYLQRAFDVAVNGGGIAAVCEVLHAAEVTQDAYCARQRNSVMA